MTTYALSGSADRRLNPVLHYALHSAYLTARNAGFLLFSIGMPVILYLVFLSVYGRTPDQDGTNWTSLTMVSMAAYGSLGAAMSGGAQLAAERRSGWFRQLSVTALPARSFLWAKSLVVMSMVLPALLLVDAAGLVVGGVRAPVGAWLASLSLMWVALVPLAVLGVVIGIWVKTEVVPGVTTLSLLLLSLLGGLWFPIQAMPGAMAAVARFLPSFWLGELGRYPFLPGAAFPWAGVAVLGAWCAALTVLGALGYRRAAATSKR